MPAVRLRGKDHDKRAQECHRLNTQEGWTVEEIADEYDATPRAVYNWLKTGRALDLPQIDDHAGWYNKLVIELGSRLDDADDGDAVRLASQLAKLLGVGSAEELNAQRVQIEAAKVTIVAQAFDKAIAGLPQRDTLRAEFVTAMRELGV